jgi:hypothetical protein
MTLHRVLLAIALLLVLAAGCSTESSNVDYDGDGSADFLDCVPNDATIYPGALENCSDGVDNNCDTWIDCADFDCSPALTSPSITLPQQS